MMHGAALDAGAPLHGRAVEAFAVKPLRPGYLSEAFGTADPRELVSLYALWVACRATGNWRIPRWPPAPVSTKPWIR